ncbi:DNA-processing protein DprA [Pedobacter zeae]|uniref:DNA processing protein n=1 Tax=Pedobacter zeae TaxID=1737356 RepID=A0A7W6KCJ4_9SPHI|nr:DNA-processing protein DprA [Pedobacter zeae]MBB4108301.1 DNA processing protein [Pedobacter zeae]GGG93699.1 DNA processing protein DprA [Pedobacter zeae]
MSTLHKIALTFIKSIGPVTAKNLLAYCGSAENIFLAGKKQLLQIPGVGEKTIEAIRGSDALLRARQELDFIEKHGIEVLFFSDEKYPKRLKNCIDSPVLLYAKGTVDFNHPRIISIVGTRNATNYGKNLCKELCEVLAPYNVLIVSGLAYGIDVTTHKECLVNHIPTVGVLGHGLDRMYPKIHKTVAQKMVLNGGLLTEFPILTNPDRTNFPQRNRIIAGIADATIVVEASIKGGALITAEIANSYHKDVYAFPGRTNDVFSEGCNFLIKTNRAGLIHNAHDLIYYLGWDDELKEKKKETQTVLQLSLTPNEQRVVDALQNGQLSIDELCIQLNMQQSKLAIVVLTLEMQGIIVSLPGKIYKLV